MIEKIILVLVVLLVFILAAIRPRTVEYTPVVVEEEVIIPSCTTTDCDKGA